MARQNFPFLIVNRLGRLLHLAPTAYITFILGLSLSALLATFQFRQIDNYAKQNFERLSYRTEAEVTGRLERALQGARGLRSVYAATDQSLRREVFRRAVESHRLDVEFPGVRGFGFIQRLAPAQQAEYVKTQRADGAPEFAIRQFFPNTTQDLFCRCQFGRAFGEQPGGFGY